MTLPREVQDAIDAGDAALGNYSAGFTGHRHWQTIREYLLNQDAELEMTRRVHRWNTDRCGENLMVCRDNHEKGEACDWETFVPIERAYAAESRLAAANALLRDMYQDMGRVIFSGNVPVDRWMAKIDAHLQGAGDE